MNIHLYSSGCPKCNVLEKKLHSKGISFDTITNFDADDLIAQGFTTLPLLGIDGKLLDYTDAIAWLNKQ